MVSLCIMDISVPEGAVNRKWSCINESTANLHQIQIIEIKNANAFERLNVFEDSIYSTGKQPKRVASPMNATR